MARGIRRQREVATTANMAALLEACERRWALRVVWELRNGPRTFRELQQACGGISPSVLQRRLHGWRDSNLIESIPRLGYRLTSRGEQLFLTLARLDAWVSHLPG